MSAPFCLLDKVYGHKMPDDFILIQERSQLRAYKKKATEPYERGHEVFVLNLPRDILMQYVYKFMVECGEIYDIRFLMDFSGFNRDTSASKSEWLECKQVSSTIIDDTVIMDIFANCEVYIVNCKDFGLKYFSTVDVFNILRTADECETNKTFSVLNADQSHSDLQPAVYEGGLKIWECTYDLLNYIVENDLPLKEKKVLDLGCGTGLVGILCLIKGASCTFQDYNTDVVQYITMPNVKLNDDKYLNTSKFYAGDWESFNDILGIEHNEDKYDYIFTSETIYNTDNYNKLHKIFKETLKRDGEIYVAAKSYYFGVGGGISLFEDFLKSEDTFNFSRSWTCPQGVKREILKIRFK